MVDNRNERKVGERSNMNHTKPNPAQPGPQKRKLSEMISEFAGDFIQLGQTPEAKQNYLTGACTAWNIASAPPERRKKLVDNFVAEYKRHNANIDEAALAAIRKDMEQLIDVKLKMFPGDVRQIVSAQYISTKAGDRIEVASATV